MCQADLLSDRNK